MNNTENTYKFNKFDKRPNTDKIISIFLDYSVFYNHTKGHYCMEITDDQLNIIAGRIEKEVMNIQDDNEFVGLKDLTKTTSTIHRVCCGDPGDCDSC
jgi:hypothetical protein